MAFKKWSIPTLDKPLANRLAEECGVDPFAALLLCARGFCTPEEIEEFLSDDAPLGDPFEIKDMYKAADRVRLALENFEKIAVFGDYDCDGVTATCLLYGYLSDKGADVLYHIPERSDGYGMSREAVDRLHAAGVSLILTVDNGISAVEEVAYAATLGIDVVVTDHHLPGKVLPAAVAVVDPHRADCPSYFKNMAGVGVAFKLVCALEERPPEELLPVYADLVALGTVADVMPLVGENRTFVQYGIRAIQNGGRPGVAALLRAASASGRPVTSTTIAYMLAPRINAAGRIGSPTRAVTLLLEREAAAADLLAQEICEDNARRQEIEREIAAAAVEAVTDQGLEYDRVIVVAGEGWHHGVVGIAAARLAERFGRPVILLSIDGETATGSGRSVAGFDLFSAVRSAEALLTRYGGHTLAAGMSLKTADIPAFRQEIEAYAAEHYPVMPFPELRLDCKLNPAALSVDLARTAEVLAPFGSGNPQPVFGLFGLKLERIQGMGGDKHVRLILSRGGAAISAVKFGVSPADFPYRVGDVVNLAAVLEVNLWQGSENLSIQIRDIQAAVQTEEDFYLSVRAYEAFRRGETGGFDPAALLITREDAAEVFRAVRAERGEISLDALFARLAGRLTYAKQRVACDVLCELGVLLREGERLSLPPDGGKVDLASSDILTKLKSSIVGNVG